MIISQEEAAAEYPSAKKAVPRNSTDELFDYAHELHKRISNEAHAQAEVAWEKARSLDPAIQAAIALREFLFESMNNGNAHKHQAKMWLSRKKKAEDQISTLPAFWISKRSPRPNSRSRLRTA